MFNKLFSGLPKQNLTKYLPLVSLAITSLVALRFFYNVDMRVAGNDMMVHVYKVWLLSDQICELKWPLWGSWDPNWYCGYPYLQTYAPLFYYLAALLKLAFDLSPADAVKLLVFITFSLSSLTMYFCSQSIINNRLASFVSSLVYSLIPMHIILLVNGGTIHVLSSLFVPLVFLFTHRLLTKKGSNYTNLVLASLFLTATILAHHGAGTALMAVILAYLILRRLLLKDVQVKVFLIIPLALLLSAFFVMPLIMYMLTYVYFVYPITLSPIASVPKALELFFFPVSIMAVGLVSFTFGLVIPALLLIKGWREHKNVTVYLLTALTILFICILTRGGTWHILPLDVLSRSMPILPFFLAILSGWCLLSLDKSHMYKLGLKREHIMALAVVMLLLLEVNFVSVYHPPTPDRYMNVYNYLKSDGEWFRVFQVPTSPTMGGVTMYGGSPIVDGISFPPRWIQYFVVKSISNAGGYSSLEGRGWGDIVNDVDSVINTLRIFGVKYIIVDSKEPVYPSWVAEKIFLNLNESRLVDMVAGFSPQTDPDEGRCIYVFKLKEWYPVVIASGAFVLDDGDEIERFYEIVSDKTFDPESAIFLSRDNDLNSVPWKLWRLNETVDMDHVDYTLRHSYVDDLNLSISLNVDRACFVYVPINYYPGLTVMVNGGKIEFLKALPGFIALYLPSEGTYSIRILRQLTLFEMTSLAISFSTLGILVAGMVYRKKKKPNRGSNPNKRSNTQGLPNAHA